MSVLVIVYTRIKISFVVSGIIWIHVKNNHNTGLMRPVNNGDTPKNVGGSGDTSQGSHYAILMP